jgi:hypothetical protein
MFFPPQVVGKVNMEYNLWGETVTIAKQMQELGKTMCVHATSETMNLVGRTTCITIANIIAIQILRIQFK